LLRGTVYVELQEETAAAALRLTCSGKEIGFTPLEHFDPRSLSGNEDWSLDLTDIIPNVSCEPPEQRAGERYAIWVNEYTDWALSGGQTAQIMVVERSQACSIHFTRKIDYARQGSEDAEFAAELACHRAQAEIEIIFTDTLSGVTRSETVAFAPQHTGGQIETGYQKLRVALPRNMAQVSVQMVVHYRGYVDDGTGVEPFMFIAEPRVSKLAKRTSITRPARLLSDGNAAGSNWFSAPVPGRLGAGSELMLALGPRKQVIYTGETAEITIDENYGHSLVVSASNLLNAVVCIDGNPVSHISIGKRTLVRLPVAYLNGLPRHVCLKDASATQILFEQVMLLPAIITPAEIIQRETPPPYPTQIFPQTPYRYEALRQHMHNATGQTDLPQISYALSVLEGGYARVKLKPLQFPVVDAPDVSIIIPAHNKVEVTYLALCSLLVAYNKASFEVIVVDDASSDETADLESFVSGITVLHNAEPQRFIRACNAGAAKARGRYIALLNNDVEVTNGWLDALLDAFVRFPNVGLAGSKLLYPDGQLQDAGGIIWNSGNPWNYGNKQNAFDCSYSYARQADYLSGAAMLMPTTLWQQVGGLSNYLEPMYFEDTDFAFKIREAGFATWFIPSSVVFHFEGMTSGTDTSKGYKRFQEVNRPKFKRRWARAYAGHGKEGMRPDLEKDRGIIGRVLFVDYTTPRLDQDAGSYAAMQEIRLVQSLGYKVTFLPTNMAHIGSYTTELQNMGVEVIHAPFYLSPAEYLERHAADFDAAYITRYYVAQEILPRLRQIAPQVKVLLNNADLHFLREIRTSRVENSDALLQKARQTREKELDVISRVDVVLSYNDSEHSVLEAYTEGASTIMKCPWVVKISDSVPGLAKRKGLAFLGGFNHYPNKEGIIWFVNEVMPNLVNYSSDLSLSIYGSAMGPEIKALATEQILPKGFVENVADAFDPHRVFVAPLLSGAGMKGKVLSALSHGIPCVLSPIAAEGIGLRHGTDCLIVEKASDWASAILRLTEDDALWTRISENALAYVEQAYSFKSGRVHMRAAFEAAGLFQSND
jgi:O-antigen biosynthesis protein